MRIFLKAFFVDTVPYGEFNAKYLDVQNQNEIIAADIYIKQEFWISTPNSERNCLDIKVDQFINCYRNEMLSKLQNNTCWIPVMKYLRFPQNWPECKNDSEALNLMKMLNKIEKESLQNSDCVMPCKAKKFKVSGNYYSRNAFEAWQDYDPEYYYLYVVYSTLTVRVFKEEYVYDFATALVAIGGSMGLLLGYSCNSLFGTLADFIERYCMDRIEH